jgi:hypothetical protein
MFRVDRHGDGDLSCFLHGYSVFALRATTNVQNLQQQDSILHLEFGHFLVCSNRPKGEQKTAQGFSPGNGTHKEIALKGRPNSIDYNV